MKSKLYFAFALGAVSGALCTWYYVKDKYEKIAQEEIDSVKEVFKTHNLVPIKDEERQKKADQAHEKPSIMQYSDMLERNGYKDYSTHTESEDKVEEKMEKKFGKDIPYVIAPEEFGENEDYEKISLTYFSKDGIVTDENDEVVKDAGEVLGDDFADHFGEYEDDSIHIRNDKTGCDYEVLYDDRSSEDVIGPHS